MNIHQHHKQNLKDFLIPRKQIEKTKESEEKQNLNDFCIRKEEKASWC